jgi:hypothetical protein
LTPDENKALTRRFCEEVWNAQDLSRLDELVTEDITLHVGGGSFSGRDAMLAIANQWFAQIWEDFDRVRFWMQLGVELAVPAS